MFDNVRGVKSKLNSIRNIIEEEKPTIIGLVETKLDEEDIIEIEGYEIRRRERKTEGGGVLIAYREEIKNIINVVREVEEDCEMLWMKINNQVNKIRIGIIYMPQEDSTTYNKLKNIYSVIEEEIRTAFNNKEKLLIMGDLNCKVGNNIPNNNAKVTKGGRLLLKLVKKYNLSIVNAEACCQGLWTRARRK
ncbi:MAG: endonuclease/exonuclease/phosphatase family protein [Nitrosopumilus sp.]|nr:endonuclease/exonuclease/phosphatase family protein [Nitrosopumilus sp.]